MNVYIKKSVHLRHYCRRVAHCMIMSTVLQTTKHIQIN